MLTRLRPAWATPRLSISTTWAETLAVFCTPTSERTKIFHQADTPFVCDRLSNCGRWWHQPKFLYFFNVYTETNYS